MITTVYRLPDKHDLSHNCLIAHLRSITPIEAIERLQRAGVLAIEGLEPSSIMLVGYSYETSILLRSLRMYHTFSAHKRQKVLHSLERLASIA